jgi:hypothetical protein
MRIPTSVRAAQLAAAVVEERPGRTRVVRVIEYKGPADWLDKVLAKSLNGFHTMGRDRSITAITVDAEHLPYEIERQLALSPRDENWQPWFGTTPSSDVSES